MPNTRTRFLWFIAALVLLVYGGIAWNEQSKGTAVELKIRSRYQQMRSAISAGDTAAAEALFASGLFTADKFRMLGTFAKPLRPDARVGISGSEAWVCPVPAYHYGVIPGGDSVEMIAIDGEWYFTGKVSID